MILPVLMFVFGAWCVQQLPHLPNAMVFLSLGFSFAVMLVMRYWLTRLSPSKAHISFALRPLLLGLAAFIVGFCWASGFAYWRMSDALPQAMQQQPVLIVGVVASVPARTARGERFAFNVERVLTPGAIVPSHISLNQYRDDYFASNAKSNRQRFSSHRMPVQLHAGQRWQLQVRLKRPHSTQNPHGFDYEAWALAENIRAIGSIQAGPKQASSSVLLDDFVWQPQYVIARLRERVKDYIGGVLGNKPYAGIIQALVMGDDSEVSRTESQIFLRTGTSHLVSISGLHITMLSGLAFGLVLFLWRRSPSLTLRLPAIKAATFAGVLVALMYSLLAGFSVPTQRTFYMLSVFAAALWSGKQVPITQVLSLALFTVVLIDPWAVISPGFWLSFGAVAMLGYALGARVGELHWLVVALKTQWAVTIGMLPLLLLMFNQSSIVSPFANAFAIPVISFVVTPLALTASFLGLDSVLQLSYLMLKLCMQVLSWLSALPNASWQQAAPPSWTLFPALFGVMWVLLPRGFPMRYLGLVGFLPMLMFSPVRPHYGEIKASILDVGQGLSVVVQTAKHTLLYDAGPRYNAQNDAGTQIVLPYLRGEGVSVLDGFFVSHDDDDHSGGMQSVLGEMPVTWLASSLPQRALLEIKTRAFRCYAGQKWSWDGVTFEVLYPSWDSYTDPGMKDNNRSCVLKIISQSGSLLLTGDIEKSAEISLLSTKQAYLGSDVMVAPHHGSKTSSSEAFIAAVAPSVSIFTVGYLNRFKHPAPSVVARYRANNTALYRSDSDGALLLHFKRSETGQSEITVRPWRSQYRRYWHDE